MRNFSEVVWEYDIDRDVLDIRHILPKPLFTDKVVLSAEWIYDCLEAERVITENDYNGHLIMWVTSESTTLMIGRRIPGLRTRFARTQLKQLSGRDGVLVPLP